MGFSLLNFISVNEKPKQLLYRLTIIGSQNRPPAFHGCSTRLDDCITGKGAEKSNRGRAEFWSAPVSGGLARESTSVGTGWTLGVGWG